ncbi:MAG: flavodoxin domain-containing protein [Proteobacteria bacterium]|nr:flavodoxin domain-containing protein [Pseudomonadota bacterium]MBU1687667.1 flavodoxin domain-containing protein [Pseudomonadota bacterium]
MSVIEIKKNVFSVGAVDWNIRDFHGYSTSLGTTYNSYLIKDEKIALFDTVKRDFKDDLLYHIGQIVDPEKIDYIIVNHVEMDHSGSLPELINIIKPEKLFCSKNGHRALLEHFHQDDWPYEIVKTGDTLNLGSKTVTFIETPMLHWPDSMFSYIAEDKLLISSDAFGQHVASTEKYADELDVCDLMHQAAKYYANILTVFSPNIQRLLVKVAEMGIEIDMIAPDHGVIWRDEKCGEILAAYDHWSRYQSADKVLVIYESMWKSTEKMANAIASELSKGGLEVKMLNLKVNHRSDIMTEVLDAKAMILGSSTLNNNMLPVMADFLTYFKGLRPKNKVMAAFGSYGWSGEAVKHINQAIEGINLPLAHPGVRVKNVPTEENFEECRELARAVVAAVKELE